MALLPGMITPPGFRQADLSLLLFEVLLRIQVVAPGGGQKNHKQDSSQEILHFFYGCRQKRGLNAAAVLLVDLLIPLLVFFCRFKFSAESHISEHIMLMFESGKRFLSLSIICQLIKHCPSPCFRGGQHW